MVATAKVLLAILLVLGALLGYATYAEQIASRKSETFCQSIQIGSDAKFLQGNAIEAGAASYQTKWFTPKGENAQLSATFTGVFPLSRHICWIEARDGRVISKKTIYLD